MNGLTRRLTKVKRRVVTPPVFISRPASRKKGIAIKMKLSIFWNARRAIMVGTRGSSTSPKKYMAPAVEATPAPNPTGKPIRIRATRKSPRRT